MVTCNTLQRSLQRRFAPASRGSTSIAQLYFEKLATQQRRLPRHTPSCGSSPLDGDLCFATSVLLGFLAVLRAGEILPFKWVHVR